MANARAEADKSDPKNEIEYLTDKLKSNIKQFSAKRDRGKKFTHMIKGAAILIGALTTVTLGIKGYFTDDSAKNALSITALILSAIGTSLASWDSFAQYPMKWIMARGTLVRLYTIKDELDFMRCSGDVSPKKLATIFNALEEVLKTDTDNWTLRRVDAISGPSGHH